MEYSPHCCRLRSVVGHLVVVAFLVAVRNVQHTEAQTEGDTGYDYNDAYDDDYDDNSVLGLEPEFDVKIVNVTVVAGQTAVLPCSIDYLGKYKVCWLTEGAIPLTFDDRRMIDDPRFSIVRPYIKEWNLQIQDIRWEDQGTYRCTINTAPIKEKVVQLHVKVPAQIIDELSSNDETVQEGDTVALVCNVTGVPRPEVTWYRRPATSKITERESKMCKPRAMGPGIGLTGEMIIIQNVTRYCDDIYECVARNGVPPAVSRQIRVTVEFPPEITMPNRRIGQELGRDTILECIITAYPHAVNYWEKDGKRLISSSPKYRIEAYDEGDNTLTLSLRVQSLEENDYGEYTCVAANALGTDRESMHIYKISKPQSPPSSSNEATHPLVVPLTQTPLYPKPTPSHKEPYKGDYPNYNTIGKEENNNDLAMDDAGNTTDDTDDPEDAENTEETNDSSEIPPTVIIQDSLVMQHIGRDVVLVCRVRATPSPFVYWEKDGSPLIDGEKYKQLVEEGVSYVTVYLAVHDLVEEDYGEYNCVGINGYGSANHSVDLIKPH